MGLGERNTLNKVRNGSRPACSATKKSKIDFSSYANYNEKA